MWECVGVPASVDRRSTSTSSSRLHRHVAFCEASDFVKHKPTEAAQLKCHVRRPATGRTPRKPPASANFTSLQAFPCGLPLPCTSLPRQLRRGVVLPPETRSFQRSNRPGPEAPKSALRSSELGCCKEETERSWESKRQPNQKDRQSVR